MTIWILALLFLSCSAVAGFCFGAIRTACSLIGLLVAVPLAFPLAHFVTPALGWFGMKNPVYLWATAPIVTFWLVMIVFKIIGLVVHKKVSLFYKYKAGDLRMGLWNRMNVRVGLCLGLVDGAIYTVLASLVLCLPGYATTQLVIGDQAGWMVKGFNLLAHDAQSSGMDKIIAGLDPMPPEYYNAMDMAGLIYHNDLLEARLGRYPGFMTLGERPEFQGFATDKAYLELRQKQAPVSEILNHPLAQTIINNPNMLKELWGIIVPDLADLEIFLRTGQSPKFDTEKIVGRWSFNLNGALKEMRANRPNLKPAEMAALKQVVVLAFAKTTLMAAPGGEVFVKEFGTVTFPAPAAPGAAPGAAPAAQPPPGTTPPGQPGGARGGRGGARGGAPAGARGGAGAGGRGALPPGPRTAPPVAAYENINDGRWTANAGKYQVNLGRKAVMEAVVEGNKLTMTGGKLPTGDTMVMSFDRDF